MLRAKSSISFCRAGVASTHQLHLGYRTRFWGHFIENAASNDAKPVLREYLLDLFRHCEIAKSI
jgi:hypothetical protein